MRQVRRALGVAIICLGVASLATGADVTLCYKMTVGQKLVYNVTSNGGGTMQAAGQTDALRVAAQFRYVMECTGVGEDGNLTILHKLEAVQAQALRGEQPIPVSINMPSMTTIITPSGRIVQSEIHKAEAPAGEGLDLGAMLGGGMGSMGAGSQLDVAQFFGSMSGPGFPTEPVHVGSRWKDAVTLTNEAGQKLTVEYLTALLDYAVLNERSCARLKTDYEAPLQLSLLGGEMFNLRGKTTGSQIAYFDYEGGKLIRSDGTSDTQMTMSVPQLFGGGNSASASATVRVLTTVVLREQQEEGQERKAGG